MWDPILKKIKQREMNTIMYDNNEKMVAGILQCFECKSHFTKYVELQTRSADEPATIFAQCSECGHHWTE